MAKALTLAATLEKSIFSNASTPARPALPPMLEKYSEIREQFHQFGSPQLPVNYDKMNNQMVYHKQSGTPFLSQRFGKFETLFLTLTQGIVEDPDYAVRKDVRIYDRMSRDPQIFYCLEVRKAATTSLPWTIKPPKGQEKNQTAVDLAERVEKRLRKIPRFTVLIGNILDALLPGLSVNELVWKVNNDGEYVIKDHFPMNKDRFKFDRHGNLRLLTPQASNTGIALPNYKFITHTYRITDGSWKDPETAGYVYYGKGLADTPLYHYFYFKISALKFYLQSLERYGNPAKIFYTGPQNRALAAKMSEIMLALKNDSVAAIPGSKGTHGEGVSVDIVKTPLSAAMFKNFLEYVDRLITRAILGQDLMTENVASVGSRAASAVHKTVFNWIAEADKNLLGDTLDRTLVAASN